MTTGKTIVLTRWTFIGKVMSVLFNMLSVCHSFSSKEQASFNYMAAVILESKKIKFLTVSIVSPSIYHEVMGADAKKSWFFESRAPPGKPKFTDNAPYRD